MVGRRYFYYLLILNAVVNVTNYVPRILIEHRYAGAVSSILLSIPLGLCFILLFEKVLAKFPGQGLPEMLSFLPKGLQKALLAYHVLLWYTAGLITLLAFSDIVRTFINPSMQNAVVLSLFLVLVCLSARLPGLSILFALEIVLLVDLPFSVFFTYKSFFNDLISYDSMLDALTYVGNWPQYTAIAATTFLFSGYTNMVIFNRVIKQPGRFEQKRKQWVVAGLASLATFIAFMSFLVPIGFEGMNGAGRHIYAWLSASDSMRIEYFFIERIVYVFLLIYIGISLMSSIIHWHVAVEMVKGMFQMKRAARTGWLTVAAFAAVTLIVQAVSVEYDVFAMGKLFLRVRLVSEVLLFLLIYYAARRKEGSRENPVLEHPAGGSADDDERVRV